MWTVEYTLSNFDEAAYQKGAISKFVVGCFYVDQEMILPAGNSWIEATGSSK